MKNVLKNPVISEKAAEEIKENRYVFEVGIDCNKIEVRDFIEKTYKVVVEKVNIMNKKGKKRRRGRIVGMTKKRKKAYVTLKEGQSIDEVKVMF
ncbi:MAG: 50S ribosomal protein L23 [bacterium]|nr:50S ribosomal protein L23 [bacterium]